MNRVVPQQVLDERSIAYAICDEELCVQEINGEISLLWDAEMAGTGSPLGRRITDLVPELVGSEAELLAVLAGEQPNLFYNWVNRDAGEDVVLYLSLSVHPYEEEGEKGILYLVEDVTDQGVMQQELMQRHNELLLLQRRLEQRNRDLAAANAELKLADEIKSTFLSLAAHELRTPLTTIYGYLELLQDGGLGDLSPQQGETVDLMVGSSRRLLATVSHLLDAVRIESDRLELILRPHDLDAIVERAVVRVESQLQAKGQTLDYRSPSSLPPALCDATRTEQVLAHVLSSASDFTPSAAEIRLSLSLTPDAHFVLVSIGPVSAALWGEDELAPHEAYRQAPGRRDQAAGIDLGVQVTRSLVELHGGRIWTAEAEGLCLHATFPALEEVVVPDPVADRLSR